MLLNPQSYPFPVFSTVLRKGISGEPSCLDWSLKFPVILESPPVDDEGFFGLGWWLASQDALAVLWVTESLSVSTDFTEVTLVSDDTYFTDVALGSEEKIIQ